MKRLSRKKAAGLICLALMLTGLLFVVTNYRRGAEKEVAETDVLSLVTPCSPDMYESVILEFEQRYGCRVNIIEMSEEDIYTELRANGGKLEGDVIFGISENLAEKSSRSFSVYQPFMQTEMVLVYNLNVIEAREAPKSLVELGDDRWKGTIGCVHENTSFMYAAIKEYAGETGMTEEEWRALESNIALYAASEDEVADGIIEGKYLVGIVSKQKALMMTREDSSVKYTKPGKTECPLRFDVCISRDCRQQEKAADFLTFCKSSSMEQYLTEFLYFERVEQE